MTVPGTALLVLSSSDVPSEAGTGGPIWNLAAVGFFALLLGAGLLPLVRLPRLTRAVWAFTPFVGMALNASWFWQPEAGQALVPWTWILGPSVVGLATLAWRPAVAYILAIGWALSVPCGALLATGNVTKEVLALTAVHSADVVFVGLYVIVRSQLRDRYAAEHEVATTQAELDQAHHYATARTRVTALIHDDVLTTLNAAVLGHEPRALMAVALEARRVTHEEIDRLTQEVDSMSPQAPVSPLQVSVAELAADLARLAQSHGATYSGNLHSPDAKNLAEPTTQALLGASREALRNAQIHASGAPRYLTLTSYESELTIEIADSGPGFDIAAVSSARLGVRASIIARVAGQPDCEATVISKPDEGTRVLLMWRQP